MLRLELSFLVPRFVCVGHILHQHLRKHNCKFLSRMQRMIEEIVGGGVLTFRGGGWRIGGIELYKKYTEI